MRTAGLILKHPTVDKARHPLSAYADESIFKLYLYDVGMLGAWGGLSPKVLLNFDFGSFKVISPRTLLCKKWVALESQT